MRKFYKEYLYIPKNGKIRDKVFSARITLAVCISLFLMSVAGLSAYAYFSSNTQVSISSITAAQYDLEYSVTDENDSPKTPQSNGNYLLGTGTYSVSITSKDIEYNAKTGFCIVDIDGEKYYTAQIGTDVNTETGQRETLTFNLVVPEDSEIEVIFAAHWGTSSNYDYISNQPENDNYIVDGDTITVESISGASSFSARGESGELIYTVQVGDTLYSIAKEFHTTVAKIIDYNNMTTDPSKIQIGYNIKIPPTDYQIPVDEAPSQTTTETVSDTTDNQTTETQAPDIDTSSEVTDSSQFATDNSGYEEDAAQ